MLEALHVGQSKAEAPALQEKNTGSLGALPDCVPLQGRPPVPVGGAFPAPVWVLTR
jgi:hypothetical protein